MRTDFALAVSAMQRECPHVSRHEAENMLRAALEQFARHVDDSAFSEGMRRRHNEPIVRAEMPRVLLALTREFDEETAELAL